MIGGKVSGIYASIKEKKEVVVLRDSNMVTRTIVVNWELARKTNSIKVLTEVLDSMLKEDCSSEW